MSRFIGLKSKDEKTSYIVNIDRIDYLNVEDGFIGFDNISMVPINKPSVKVLLDILMEMEYKGER